MQNACGFLFGLSTISIVLIPSRVNSTISPGNTSRTYLAPILRKPHDSDDITQPSASFSSSESFPNYSKKGKFLIFLIFCKNFFFSPKFPTGTIFPKQSGRFP